MKDSQAEEPEISSASRGDPNADASDHETFRRTALIISLGLIFNALVLAVDLSLPAQYATAILYSLPVLAAFWLPSRRATMVLALAGTICSSIGYGLSPIAAPAGPLETMVYRVAALVVLWGTAVLAIRHQSARTLAERSSIAGRHQVALLRAILDTVPDALVVIDQDGTIQSFSQSAELLFGYRESEAVGRNVSLLMPSDERKAHDGYLQRYLRTGERRIIGIGRVVEGETKDGRKVPVELSVGEAKVASHRIYIGFMRDLSARQRIEEELRQAQKMEAIGQLTGGIAHDFNNLLLVIAGNLDLIARQPDQLDTVALKEAQEAVELGAELTAQLLAFGRKHPLEPRNVDVADLVDGVASMLRRTLGDNIELYVDIRGKPGETFVDAAQLQNALLNLAINARDAMPDGGRLVVSVFDTYLDTGYAQKHPEVRPGHYTAVQIADTGTGMSEEVRERVFEPFFTTKHGTGSGLGLSMVYGFAKQSNGHVEIDSTVGRGTTVSLYLPRADEGRAQAMTTPVSRTAPSTPGETILVVEDDARVRRVVVSHLKEFGYHVVEARSGPEALRHLRAIARVDLLFTDVVLSQSMSGFELARVARAERPRLRVLYTTGYTDPEIAARDGKSQMPPSQILRKPYSKTLLASTIRTVLDEPT